MSERGGKFCKGITRNKFPEYLKSKGKKTMIKKRFSKASLRKTSTHMFYLSGLIRNNAVNTTKLFNKSKLN